MVSSSVFSLVSAGNRASNPGSHETLKVKCQVSELMSKAQCENTLEMQAYKHPHALQNVKLVISHLSDAPN